MSWEEIKPARGVRPPGAEAVTVSWRRSGSSMTPALIVICSKSLTERLGWVKSCRIVAARDRVAGLLRIHRAEQGGFSCVHVKQHITQKFQLDDVKSDVRKAEPVPFRVDEQGALIVTLPDWAAPQRRSMERAVQAREQAVARVAAPVAPPAAPAAPARQPYVGIMSRLPDPGIGKRSG